MSEHTPILIVGAGPVGLALAGELGWRGIPCTLIEKTDGAIEQPKMDIVGPRTMEFCRRWGIADWVRDAPYPGDYPQDCVYVTGLNGYELGRERFPGAGAGDMPAAEPAEARARAAGHVRPDPAALRGHLSACAAALRHRADGVCGNRRWCRRADARRRDRRDRRHHGRLSGRHRRRRQPGARTRRHHHERQSGADLHHQRDVPLRGLSLAARQGPGLPVHLRRAGGHLAHHRGDQRRRPLPHVHRRLRRQGEPHRGRYPQRARAGHGARDSITRSCR